MKHLKIKKAYSGEFYISTDNGMKSKYLCRDGVVRHSCNELGGQDGWYNSFEAAQKVLDQYKNKQETDSVKLNVAEEVTVKKNYSIALNLTIEEAIEVMHCIGKSNTGVTFSVYDKLRAIFGYDLDSGDVDEIERKAARFLESR